MHAGHLNNECPLVVHIPGHGNVPGNIRKCFATFFYGPGEIGTNGQQLDDKLHPRSPFLRLGHQFDGNYVEKIT